MTIGTITRERHANSQHPEQSSARVSVSGGDSGSRDFGSQGTIHKQLHWRALFMSGLHLNPAIPPENGFLRSRLSPPAGILRSACQLFSTFYARNWPVLYLARIVYGSFSVAADIAARRSM